MKYTEEQLKAYSDYLQLELEINDSQFMTFKRDYQRKGELALIDNYERKKIFSNISTNRVIILAEMENLKTLKNNKQWVQQEQ